MPGPLLTAGFCLNVTSTTSPPLHDLAFHAYWEHAFSLHSKLTALWHLSPVANNAPSTGST